MYIITDFARDRVSITAELLWSCRRLGLDMQCSCTRLGVLQEVILLSHLQTFHVWWYLHEKTKSLLLFVVKTSLLFGNELRYVCSGASCSFLQSECHIGDLLFLFLTPCTSCLLYSTHINGFNHLSRSLNVLHKQRNIVMLLAVIYSLSKFIHLFFFKIIYLVIFWIETS